MIFHIVRHGQTEDNFTKTLAGQLPGKLTNLGIKQAYLTGSKIKNEYYDYAYVSDLGRTIETFDQIKKQNKQINKTIIQMEPLIREKHGGVLQGQKLEIPKLMACQQKINIRDFKPDQGESWKDVYQRSVSFLNILIFKFLKNSCQKNQTEINQTINDQQIKTIKILLISHGGFIMEMFNYIKYQYYNIQPDYKNNIPNCSISKIKIYCQNTKNQCDVKCQNNDCIKIDIIERGNKEHLKSLY